jgi:HEAT repeat protein
MSGVASFRRDRKRAGGIRRFSSVSIAIVAGLSLGVGLFGAGCSSEESSEGTAAGTMSQEEFAEALAESLRAKRASGPKEAALIEKYEPEHPPEIEARLVEIRFLEPDDPQTLARLETELRDDNEAIRIEGIEKLEDIGDDAVFPLLGERLARDPSAAARLRAAEALEFLAGEKAADQLVRGLGDSDAGVREAVAEGLEFLATAAHVAALEKALAKEGDREIQASLQDAIENASLPAAAPAAPAAPAEVDAAAGTDPATGTATAGAEAAEKPPVP